MAAPPEPSSAELEIFRQEVRLWLEENEPPKPDFKLPDSFLEVSSPEQFEHLRAWQRSVYDAGYLGMTWPSEYGGGGRSQAYQDIVNEEIFGPVVTIMTFKTDDEAAKLANDTPFGLASYFYSQNISRIHRFSDALQFGMVGINEGAISNPAAPFGGVKESGYGREGSKYGLDDYSFIQYRCLGGI